MTAAKEAAVLHPRQGVIPRKPRPERVLLVCYYDPAGISTVPETVAHLQAGSRFEVRVINVFEHNAGAGDVQLHASVDLGVFDAVVIHNTVSYDVETLRSLDRQQGTSLRDFEGLKVLMKQDENHRFHELAQYVRDTGFHFIFTCLPAQDVPLVYPGVDGVHFEHMLTGYVTPALRRQFEPDIARPIDIGYRGSIQPLSFGWLAYEKRKIGKDVERLLGGQGYRLDISSRWEDRLGGDRWLDFLRSSKATLGAESGASIFDLYGTLAGRLRVLEDQHAHVTDEDERAEAILSQLADLENRVHYNQLSPRHFEAAACGTLQLLYPGTYSGLLQSGRHYFELARDYSNLSQAMDLVSDDVARKRMAVCAYEEVVLDKRNWIEGFVERFDTCLEEGIDSRVGRRQVTASAPRSVNVMLLACHDPVVDPRLGWIEERAPEGIRIQQLGVLRDPSLPPKLERTARGNLVMANPRIAETDEFWTQVVELASATDAGRAAALELLRIRQWVAMPAERVLPLLGAPMAQQARNADVIWYLHYILDTSAALIRAGLECRNYQAIIATDLDSLPAALVLKAVSGVRVIYDAHEYWPEQDARSLEYEKEFWAGMESRLCVHADHRQTVSSGLAALMAALYGVPFDTVPNCEPLDRVVHRQPRLARQECHFLYQGSFATRRGIDLLIKAWPLTQPEAMLHLRGPDNDYRQEMIALARETGLLHVRIFFPAAVCESELVEAARDADVGIVPYVPYGAYRHCCPNKLSQYMAAGLPILANQTDYVAYIVDSARCGSVVDFQRPHELAAVVDALTSDAGQRERLGDAAQAFFRTEFNWDIAARPLYTWIASSVRPATADFQVFAPRTQAARPAAVPASAPTEHETEAEVAAIEQAPLSSAVPVPVTSPTTGMLRCVWRLLPAPLKTTLGPLVRAARRIAGRQQS